MEMEEGIRIVIIHRGRLVRESLAFVLAQQESMSVLRAVAALAMLSVIWNACARMSFCWTSPSRAGRVLETRDGSGGFSLEPRF